MNSEKEAYFTLLRKPWYPPLVRIAAKNLHSDGCTGVLDIYLPACWEHDVAYRTHATVLGLRLTRAQADERFRWAMQFLSPLGCFSPLAWWRWRGVRLFGRRAWESFGGTRRYAHGS